ncbi:YIP1 family protein [Ectobacillus sp. JY-23]|uniref:Yip1 family protein n=1 Tax=Ectobacillus sp. JY-23 TaxID=2933872 RepID=UPI001FF1FD23|nr:Yip1 family protein [Ectobacillus sp. JY-23]UOY91124.1 YIP1 family protein [Ectobacillus sp. JY-23]
MELETNVQPQQKPSLFGMIASPTLQFERMKDKTKVGLPMFMVMLLLAILAAVTTQFLPTAEQLEGFPEPSPTTTMIFAFVGGLVGGYIVLFVVAALYKILALLFGESISYKKLLLILVFTGIIGVLGQAVNVVLMAIIGGDQVSYTSLAPLFESGTIAHSIAGSIEVFTIWNYVLLVLGLQIVGGFSKNKAIAFVVTLFVISTSISAAVTYVGSTLESIFTQM